MALHVEIDQHSVTAPPVLVLKPIQSTSQALVLVSLPHALCPRCLIANDSLLEGQQEWIVRLRGGILKQEQPRAAPSWHNIGSASSRCPYLPTQQCTGRGLATGESWCGWWK